MARSGRARPARSQEGEEPSCRVWDRVPIARSARLRPAGSVRARSGATAHGGVRARSATPHVICFGCSYCTRVSRSRDMAVRYMINPRKIGVPKSYRQTLNPRIAQAPLPELHQYADFLIETVSLSEVQTSVLRSTMGSALSRGKCSERATAHSRVNSALKPPILPEWQMRKLHS